MQVTPISNKQDKMSLALEKSVSFAGKTNNYYSKKDKRIVAATTALGVTAATAILAKRAGYSLNPVKMFKNFKNSYLAKVKYEWPEVIAIGAGSCLGGLAGGYIIDKDKGNRRAKNREALMHFGNISIPILTVGMLVDKVFKDSKPMAKAVAGIGGVIGGIYLANFVMNKLCNSLFQDKSNERGVEVTDLPAHLDDVVVAANYISDAKPIKLLGRIIPLALMVAGNEVGKHTKYD